MAGFTKLQQATFLVGTFCGMLPVANLVASPETAIPHFKWLSLSAIWTLAILGLHGGLMVVVSVWIMVTGVVPFPSEDDNEGKSQTNICFSEDMMLYLTCSDFE